ncbi:MAG TPA: hypothetical protein PLY87_13365, partial [Planctomycetaceae bacterium]|nr:hypothetical protein [Planctomycetaceae bacterium]
WESANLRVYDYLRAKVPIGTEPSLKDLDLLYQAVAHGCHAGLEEKTCTEVYSDRILQFDRHYSLRQFGVFGTDLVALACFFEQPWSQLSSEMSPGAQSFVFNEVGTRLRALGRIAEAIQPLTSSLRIDLTHNEWRSAAISCCNLSDTYLALGNIIDATSLAKRAVEYANRCSVDRYIHSYRESNAFVMVTCSFPRHAYTYFQGGDRTTAGQMFHESERLQGRYQPDYPLLYADVGFMYCDHLLAPAERAGWNRITEGAWMPVSRHMEPHSTATSSEGDSFDFVRTPPVTPIECCRNVAERMAKLVEWRENDDGLLIKGLDHLTFARVEFFTAILENYSLVTAQRTIDESIDYLRRASMLDVVPHGLLTRSLIRSLSGLRTGNKDARADLDEAWDIAARGPMRLHMADIHLYRARLFFREKSYPWKSPQDDIAAAEKLINECGYHRRDEELADAKRVILGNQT